MTQVLSLLFPTATPLVLTAGVDTAAADPEAVFAALMAEGAPLLPAQGDGSDLAAPGTEGTPPPVLPQPVRAVSLAEALLPEPAAPLPTAPLPVALPFPLAPVGPPEITPASARSETQSDAPPDAAPSVPEAPGSPPVIAALPWVGPAALPGPEPAKLRIDWPSVRAETIRQFTSAAPPLPAQAALAPPARAEHPDILTVPHPAAALPALPLAPPPDAAAPLPGPTPPAPTGENQETIPGPVALTAIPVPQRESDALVPINVLPGAEAGLKPSRPVPPPSRTTGDHDRNTAPDPSEEPAPRTLRRPAEAVAAVVRPAPFDPQPPSNPPLVAAAITATAEPAPKPAKPAAHAPDIPARILPEQSLLPLRPPAEAPRAAAPAPPVPKGEADTAPEVEPAADTPVAARPRLSGEEGLLRAIWLGDPAPADPEPAPTPALPAPASPPGPPAAPVSVNTALTAVVMPSAKDSPGDPAPGLGAAAKPVAASSPTLAPSSSPTLAPSSTPSLAPSAASAEPTPDQAPVAPVEPGQILDLQPRLAWAARVDAAPLSPASPLPAVPTGSPPPVPLQVAQAVTASGGAVTELTLAPEELGRVRIDLRSDGDRLTMVVSAERPETLDLLRRHSDQLVQDLRGSGHQGLDLSFSRWTGQGGDQRTLPQPSAVMDDDTPSPPPDRNDRPAAQPAAALSSGLYLRI